MNTEESPEEHYLGINRQRAFHGSQISENPTDVFSKQLELRMNPSFGEYHKTFLRFYFRNESVIGGNLLGLKGELAELPKRDARGPALLVFIKKISIFMGMPKWHLGVLHHL